MNLTGGENKSGAVMQNANRGCQTSDRIRTWILLERKKERKKERRRRRKIRRTATTTTTTKEEERYRDK